MGLNDFFCTRELFAGFKRIYWNPMSGSYFFQGSILEKCGHFWKNGRFSGRIWPDWGSTTLADMAVMGSIGLKGTNMQHIEHIWVQIL